MQIDQTPVLQAVRVSATVRDFGGKEQPMAVVTGIDIMGDTRTVQLSEEVALDLALKLLQFVQQVR